MNTPVATELNMLGLSVLVGLIHLFVAAVAARQQQGLSWGAGPRDEERPLSGTAARLDRAYRNYMETFPLFAASILGACVAGRLGPLTWWGAMLYLSGRIVYIPLYAIGVPYLRTLIWHIAIAGLAMTLATWAF